MCRVLLLLPWLALLLTPTAAAAPTPTPTRVPTRTPPPPLTATPVRATPTPIPASPTAASANVAPTAAPTLEPVALDPPEVRAVWIDAFHDGFKSPEQVDQLVGWAREAHVNALFVQVRRRGDAYYLRSAEPRTEDPDLTPGFDALQYLIDRAHQGPQRLQVHAWLATLPIWHKRNTPPADPGHVFNQHGLDADDSWLMLRDDDVAWAGTRQAGIYYLDPGNPAAARYTVDVYLNVLRNYDVDGIHLDQVRYYEGEPRRWGYNPASVARFNQRLGREPSSVPDANDPDWAGWRRDQVTALVRDVYLQAKAFKPRVAVTAAVVAWGAGPEASGGYERAAPFASVFQDWRYWLQEGIVDYVVPMDYYREASQQADWFDAWTRFQVANPGKRGVAIGVASFLNSLDASMAQLTRARALAPLGVALYSYAVPARDLEDPSAIDRESVAARLRLLFPRPAPVPDLPVTSGLAVDVPGHEDVAITADNGEGGLRTWRTDGTGLGGAGDLQPGRYRVTISAPDVDPTPFEVRVTPGTMTLVRLGPGTPVS